MMIIYALKIIFALLCSAGGLWTWYVMRKDNSIIEKLIKDSRSSVYKNIEEMLTKHINLVKNMKNDFGPIKRIDIPELSEMKSLNKITEIREKINEMNASPEIMLPKEVLGELNWHSCQWDEKFKEIQCCSNSNPSIEYDCFIKKDEFRLYNGSYDFWNKVKQVAQTCQKNEKVSKIDIDDIIVDTNLAFLNLIPYPGKEKTCMIKIFKELKELVFKDASNSNF